MTPAATAALSLLRESRDGALIWHDNGRTITRLARTAGVMVTFVHVDLARLTCERRTAGETGGQDAIREGGAGPQKPG